jgi:hypothetical protein
MRRDFFTEFDACGIRWVAVGMSLLLSLWLIFINDKINPDGALYVETAELMLAGDWAGAYHLYDWPFFSALIALVGWVTGLHLETAAMAINLVLAAVLVYVFLRITEELGGDVKTLWFAALVILTFPYLNEKRAEVVRDIGYWACYLTAVLLFLRYMQVPTLTRAGAWSAAVLVAALFRIEGLSFLVALPVAVWFRTELPLRQRLRHYLQANASTALVLTLLITASFVYPDAAEYRGRLLEPLDRLQDFWLGLTAGLQNKAELFRSQVLEVSTGPYGHYAGKSAETVLIGGLIAIVLYKLGKLLGLYCLLPLFARFRERLRSLPPESVPTLVWLVLINLGVVLVFVVDTFYLSSRFLMPLALTLLIPMPLVLTAVHERWQQLKSEPLRAKWGYLLIALWLLSMTLEGITFTRDRAYLKEAGTWIRQELPSQAKVYTNSSLVHYYSGQGIAWDAKWQYQMPPPPQQPLQAYDYAAVEKERGKFPEPWNEIVDAGRVEKIKEFEGDRGAGVWIYRILPAGTRATPRRLPKPTAGPPTTPPG